MKTEQTPLLRAVLDAGLATRTGETETTTITRWGKEKAVVIEKLSMGEPIRYGTEDRRSYPLTELVIVSEPHQYEAEDWIEESLAGMVVYWKKPSAVTLSSWGQIESCPGCGQTVIWALRQSRRSFGPYPCSERCRSRMRRPDIDLSRDCEQCGTRFTPKRKDATTCSGACRVALHRSRNASEPGASGGPGSVTGTPGVTDRSPVGTDGPGSVTRSSGQPS